MGKSPEVSTWAPALTTTLVSLVVSSLVAGFGLLYGAHAQRIATIREGRQACRLAVVELVADLASGVGALQDNPGREPLTAASIDPTINKITVLCYQEDVLRADDPRVENAIGLIRVGVKAWRVTSPSSCNGAEANVGACAWQLAADRGAEINDWVRERPYPDLWDSIRHVAP